MALEFFSNHDKYPVLSCLKKRDSHTLANKRTKWKFLAYSAAYCTFPTVLGSECFKLCSRNASFWNTTDISITKLDQQSTFWRVSQCEIFGCESKQKKLKKLWLTLARMGKLTNALETEKSNDDILPCFSYGPNLLKYGTFVKIIKKPLGNWHYAQIKILSWKQRAFKLMKKIQRFSRIVIVNFMKKFWEFE